MSSRRMRMGALAVMGLLAIGLALAVEWLPFSAAGVAADDPDYYFKKVGVTRILDIPPPVDFELSDLDGGKVRLSDLKGKVVVINFWTTWCPSCRFEMPDLEKLHQRFRARDFILLAMDLRESRQTVLSYFQNNKLSFTALLDSDGEVARSFGIRSIPTTFIIGRSGGMVGKAIGARRWASDSAFALFEQLLDNPSAPDLVEEKDPR